MIKISSRKLLPLLTALLILGSCTVNQGQIFRTETPQHPPLDEPPTAETLAITEEGDRINETATTAVEKEDQVEVVMEGEKIQADVISAEITGSPDRYQFSVWISSPDTGCDQYADWWEVITAEGELIYRRILLHSHVTEQPFVRSGSPVQIEPDTVVLVRAHMNQAGYGGKVLSGTVATGFEEIFPDPGFGDGLENAPPLPTGCNF